jgi:circadian clock protein KaiC
VSITREYCADWGFVANTVGVIMRRYFEAGGRVRRAISVVKKRSGAHEDAIREFQLSSAGLILGPPLTDFSGIFTGTPTYVGKNHLMPEYGDDTGQ